MSRFCWLVLFLFYFIISAKVGGREESSQSVSDLTDRCRTLKAISGWMGWDWLSYTAVTPRASLQSDANNNIGLVGI